MLGSTATITDEKNENNMSPDLDRSPERSSSPDKKRILELTKIREAPAIEEYKIN